MSDEASESMITEVDLDDETVARLLEEDESGVEGENQESENRQDDADGGMEYTGETEEGQGDQMQAEQEENVCMINL